jgi:hypothetical protein
VIKRISASFTNGAQFVLNEIPSDLSKKGDLGTARDHGGLTTALSPYVCTFRLSNNSISAVIRFWDKLYRKQKCRAIGSALISNHKP